MAHVHVLACGGTIASTPGEDGATPTLEAADLRDLAPAIADHADVTVADVARRPGFDTGPSTVAEVGRRARAAVRGTGEGADTASSQRGEGGPDGAADAVVVAQGTDTIEETAYQLDLTLAGVPVVVTGAQRRPDEPSSDAAANLLGAVRAAAHDRVEAGAFVAFDDELHAARDVTKAHSSKLGTFASPNAGPVATLTREGIAFHREPRSESVDLPLDRETEVAIADGEPLPDVALATSGAGIDGAPVRRAVEAGADGVVVAGTGLGNVTADLGEAMAEAAESVPVVVATRCHAGSTAAVYGTPGGGATLASHGVLRAGTLQPWKARLKLALALAAVEEPGEVERFFE